MTKDNHISRIQMLQSNISREQLGNAGGVNGKIHRLILEQIAFLGAIINKGAVCRNQHVRACVAKGVAVQIHMSSGGTFLTAQTNLPMFGAVGLPQITVMMLMEGSGYGNLASVAELITAQISVGSELGLLTAETAVPVVHIIVRPVGGEIVLMEGSGHGSFASVAALVTVDIGVGSELSLLTAEATVPMLCIVKVPIRSRVMLVQGSRYGHIASVAALVTIDIGVGSHCALLAAETAVPMVAVAGVPFLAELMLMEQGGNPILAGVATDITVKVGMDAYIALLAAEAAMPMAIVVGSPMVGKKMLVQGLGDRSLTDVAEPVAVGILVGGFFIMFTAEAAVPVGIFSGFPSGAKLMLVEVRRDRSFANIAELVAIRILVGRHIVPLTAQTAVPMVRCIKIPLDGKQMLMQGRGNGGFADVAEQITVQIFVRQNFVPLAAQTSMPVVGFVGIPFVDKQMLVQGRGNSNSTSIAGAIAI